MQVSQCSRAALRSLGGDADGSTANWEWFHQYRDASDSLAEYTMTTTSVKITSTCIIYEYSFADEKKQKSLRQFYIRKTQKKSLSIHCKKFFSFCKLGEDYNFSIFVVVQFLQMKNTRTQSANQS